MDAVIPEPQAAVVAHLAADLDALDYRSGRLRALWGSDADGALGRGQRLPAERAVRATLEAAPREADRALAAVAALFGVGVDVPVEQVSAALPRTGLNGVLALGLARREGDMVRPTALIRPQAFADEHGEGEWWIASDLDEAALRGPLPEEHVLGVGGASLTLAGLQATAPVERVLDLGTGCGIQALRARRHARTVVATDVSERALRFTRLNALLNGVTGIETRRGSLFEPVRGELFDRVVSNPPFVITPRAEGVPSYEYRDGGKVGDALVEAVVRGCAEVLAPGGTVQMLGNWEYRAGEDGLDRVRGWAEDAGLEHWIVEREVLDPVAYAELWIRDGGTTPGTDAFEGMLGAWLDDFAHRGVTDVGFGYLVLRRPRDGRGSLHRTERIARPLAEGGLGAHLTAALAAHDLLEGLDDDAFAARALVVSPDVTEARHHRPGDGDPSVIELRQGGGFGRVLSVDPALAAVVGACDGDLPLGVLVAAVAELLEADPTALRADLFPRLRRLVVDGFLTLPGADAARTAGGATR